MFFLFSSIEQITKELSNLVTFNFEKELQLVSNNITWFWDLARNYSRFETTKLDLADSLSINKTTAVEDMLEILSSRLDQMAFGPMREQMKLAEDKLRQWYGVEIISWPVRTSSW